MLTQMLVTYIHIGAGILWIGAMAYLRFIVMPSIMSAAPNARGQIMVELGPRSVTYMLRLAEVTMAAGVVNIFTVGKVSAIDMLFTTHWGGVILLGFLGTVLIYGLARAVTRPTMLRSVEIMRAMAAGAAPADAPEGAPALLEALAAKQRKMLNLQLGLAAVVILTMATARYS